jgi:hypothetical protein
MKLTLEKLPNHHAGTVSPAALRRNASEGDYLSADRSAEWLRDGRAAEQRHELTPFQLTELHPLPLAKLTA